MKESDKGLHYSTPSACGVDPRGVLRMIELFRERDAGIHGFMLLRHDQVFAEGWYHPYEKELTHTLFSLSKTFTATAVGFAVQEGLLTVEDDVVGFFPDKVTDAVCDNMRKMKVKHLLTMNTGHDPAPNIFDPSVPDYVKAFLHTDVPKTPGTQFVYNSAATYMLSAIATRVTGQTVSEYLKPRLRDPLDMGAWHFEQCPKGIDLGGYGLHVTLPAIAKFGLFFLHKGNVNGKQLLDSAWIEAASSAQVESLGDAGSDWLQGYGYQMWRCQVPNAFRGDGAFGQYMLVLPDQDMVIAINSGSNGLQTVLSTIWETILPALHDAPLCGLDAEEKALSSALASLSIDFKKGDGVVDAQAAGRMCVLADNPWGLTKMKLDSTSLSLFFGKEEEIIHFGHNTDVNGTVSWRSDAREEGLLLGSYTASFAGGSPMKLRIVWRETPFIDDISFDADAQGMTVVIHRNCSMSGQNDRVLTGAWENIGE